MMTDNTQTIILWKSKGFLEERIKSPTMPGYSLAPKLTWIDNSKLAVEFKRRSSKQEGTFTHRNAVNLFIVCELDMNSGDINIVCELDM